MRNRHLIRYFLLILALAGVLENVPARAAENWSAYLFGSKPKTTQKVPIYNSTKPRQQAPEAFKPGTREEIVARVMAMQSGRMRQYNKFRNETRLTLQALQKQQAVDAARREKEQSAQVQPVAAHAQSPAENTQKKVIFNRPGLTKPPKVFTDYR